MKYSDIRNHIHIKNKNLLKFLNKQEIAWLEKHFKFINGLLMDRIKIEELNTPSSNFKRYKDFVAVIRKEKDDKVDELKEYQDMRDRERAEELKRLREEDNKVKFTSVEPFRKDPNCGMRFVSCSDPINVGKLGSSRSFLNKRDREYY